MQLLYPAITSHLQDNSYNLLLINAVSILDTNSEDILHLLFLNHSMIFDQFKRYSK